MSVLNIVKYPADILLQVAEEIIGTEELYQCQPLIRDMIETMRQAQGRGLAAPQVGVSKRIIVYYDDSDKVDILINPVVIESTGKITSYREGCLSIPNIRRDIKRARVVVVEGLNVISNLVKVKPEHLAVSIALQHEIDHLNGITILTGKRKLRYGVKIHNRQGG